MLDLEALKDLLSPVFNDVTIHLGGLYPKY